LRRKFSERYGFKEVKNIFQVNNINDELKNRLWNTIKSYYIDSLIAPYDELDGNSHIFAKRLYDNFFKTHKEPSEYKTSFKDDFKKRYFQLQWFEIYDLIEYLYNIKQYQNFHTKINKVLEEEISGYRFIDDLIAPIISEVEIQSIEDTLRCEYHGARQHISKSLELMSDRENPDYINSIKESISAVESVVNSISGKTNVALNRCLNHLPFEIDKHFKDGIIKIYSWTSSADGIRHGVTGDKIKSSFAESKYMLVSCSAFINYLIDKQSKT
jgi:uncharacterized FlaG/YvyC family protein